MNAQLEEPWDPEPIEVHVLAWPDDEELRCKLAHEGLPRLLVIEATAAPPPAWDELEDWYREGSATADVLARRHTVQVRAARRARQPVLQGDILRVGQRWAAIPPSRLPLVSLLLARLGAVVRPAELAEAVTAGGGSSDAAAVRAALHRLSKSFADVGLRLHSVRGRGSLLDLVAD
jgi:hypothetical protein